MFNVQQLKFLINNQNQNSNFLKIKKKEKENSKFL